MNTITKMITFALILISLQALSTTYYVSPTGSDNNPGTKSSPFATIQKAHDLAAIMHLTSTSDLIDVGQNVGLPFNDASPDLGCFETTANGNRISTDEQVIEQHSLAEESSVIVYPNPSGDFFTISTKGILDYVIHNPAGKVMEKGHGRESTSAGSNLPAGPYIMKFKPNKQGRTSLKVIKK